MIHQKPIPAEELTAQLKILPLELALLFGLACCERMLPNYKKFQDQFEWGNSIEIRKIINEIWDTTQGKILPKKKINEYLRFCEENAPSSDNFDSELTTCAQNACFGLCNLLDFLIEKEIIHIVRAATSAIDSVDIFIQELEGMKPNSSTLEEEILTHRLMQTEIMYQAADLDLLKKFSKDKDMATLEFSKKWQNNNIGSIIG